MWVIFIWLSNNFRHSWHGIQIAPLFFLAFGHLMFFPYKCNDNGWAGMRSGERRQVENVWRQKKSCGKSFGKNIEKMPRWTEKKMLWASNNNRCWVYARQNLHICQIKERFEGLASFKRLKCGMIVENETKIW